MIAFYSIKASTGSLVEILSLLNICFVADGILTSALSENRRVRKVVATSLTKPVEVRSPRASMQINDALMVCTFFSKLRVMSLKTSVDDFNRKFLRI